MARCYRAAAMSMVSMASGFSYSTVPSVTPSTGGGRGTGPKGRSLGWRAFAGSTWKCGLQSPASAEARREFRALVARNVIIGWPFFGYFLLATQKKVSRLRGRDPAVD